MHIEVLECENAKLKTETTELATKIAKLEEENDNLKAELKAAEGECCTENCMADFFLQMKVLASVRMSPPSPLLLLLLKVSVESA